MAEPPHGPFASKDFHLTRGAGMAIIWPPTVAVTPSGDQHHGTLPPLLP
jgi:hypothetical protein